MASKSGKAPAMYCEKIFKDEDLVPADKDEDEKAPEGGKAGDGGNAPAEVNPPVTPAKAGEQATPIEAPPQVPVGGDSKDKDWRAVLLPRAIRENEFSAEGLDLSGLYVRVIFRHHIIAVYYYVIWRHWFSISSLFLPYVLKLPGIALTPRLALILLLFPLFGTYFPYFALILLLFSLFGPYFPLIVPLFCPYFPYFALIFLILPLFCPYFALILPLFWPYVGLIFFILPLFGFYFPV